MAKLITKNIHLITFNGSDFFKRRCFGHPNHKMFVLWRYPDFYAIFAAGTCDKLKRKKTILSFQVNKAMIQLFAQCNWFDTNTNKINRFFSVSTHRKLSVLSSKSVQCVSVYALIYYFVWAVNEYGLFMAKRIIKHRLKMYLQLDPTAAAPNPIL